jgi:hypothetical protein
MNCRTTFNIRYQKYTHDKQKRTNCRLSTEIPVFFNALQNNGSPADKIEDTPDQIPDK